MGTNNISSEGSRIEFNAAYTNEKCADIYSDSATLVYPASVKMYYVIHY